MKKKVLGLVVAAMMSASTVVFASGEMPDAYQIGDTVKLNEVQAISSDEMATTFVKDGSIYRCNTRDGKVMQIDHNQVDYYFDGITVGGPDSQIPDGGKLISESKWDGMKYVTYEIPDGTLLRLNNRNGVVESISQIMNNI